MSRAEDAVIFFEKCNCAQAVLAAYAKDLGIETDTALRAALAFGGGMGRLQETCGAVTGAMIALGLSSGYKEGDSRDKINAVYEKTRNLVNDFTREKGTVKCRELLNCNLMTEEGQKIYRETNLKENCKEYVKLASELFEKHSGSV